MKKIDKLFEENPILQVLYQFAMMGGSFEPLFFYVKIYINNF